tara:strand:- start:107 stop:886 length:780 start_codon:yes stop_codon:yes gene_type:complete
MPFFNFKEKNIHYITEGSGEVVVFLHGFLENGSMWEEIALDISKTHQVIRLDLPGFGKSDCIQAIHSMQLFAEYTKHLLSELKIDSFTIIGHSMGGYAALELAKICPKKINAFILFHSTASSDSEQKKRDRDRAVKAVNKKQSVYLKTTIPLLFPLQFQKACAPQIKKMIVDAEALNPIEIIAALKGMQERDNNNETLSNLSCKKIYIAGTLDPILSIEVLKKEAKNNGADFIEIENAGHMSHWENTKMALKEIQKALS